MRRLDEGRTKVLVVSADRALRANLTSLLQLEHDLCVNDCSQREAAAAAAAWGPDLVVVCGKPAWPSPTRLARREIYLTDMTPYESVLSAIREEESGSSDLR